MWLDQLQNQVFCFHGRSSPSPFGIWGVLLSPAGAVQVSLRPEAQALPPFVCWVWEWALLHDGRGIMGAPPQPPWAHAQDLLLLAVVQCLPRQHLPRASQTEKGDGIPSPQGWTVSEVF